MITVWLGDRVVLEIGPWYGPLQINRQPWSTTLSVGPIQIKRWLDAPAAIPEENHCGFHDTISRC